MRRASPGATVRHHSARRPNRPPPGAIARRRGNCGAAHLLNQAFERGDARARPDGSAGAAGIPGIERARVASRAAIQRIERFAANRAPRGDLARQDVFYAPARPLITNPGSCEQIRPAFVLPPSPKATADKSARQARGLADRGLADLRTSGPADSEYTECLRSPRSRRPGRREMAAGPHRGPEPVQFQPANRVRAGRQQR